MLTNAEEAQDGSARAETILTRAGFEPPASEVVLVQSSASRPGDPAFRAAVGDLTSALRQTPEVGRVKSTAVSKDGRSELVSFDVAGKADTADKHIQPVLDRVAAVQRAHPGFTLQEVGDASANQAANDVIDKDLQHAELTSVPVTFVILLLAFGAFVAAGLPVLLALSAVLATVGLGAVVSHVIHASDTTSSVVVLMGMAVGIDYSLFYLRREREERARGREPREALHAAAATSGRAVLVSGLTVVVACAGMTLSGSADFVSLGFGHPRRPHRDDRVAHGAACASRPSWRPRRLGLAPLVEARQRRVACVESRAPAGAALSPRGFSRRGGGPRRRRPAGVPHAHGERGLRLVSEEPAGREGVPRRGALVPGHAEPGGGRRGRRTT